MRRFEDADKEKLSGLKYILFDVDDTVTNSGKLTSEAYSAMWRLNERGLRLIPVTGRPAGWCDMMLREWPVYAVVCENGAFVYDYDPTGHVRMIRHPLAAADPQGLLEPVKKAVFSAFPAMRAAHDQFARIYDAAFDFAEDEPKLPLETAYAAAELCRSMGAEAKVSSIHVNAWFGAYSKADMALKYLKEYCGVSDISSEAIFFGDSPNDEPMFAAFPLSCAVSNISPFIDRMDRLPAYILDKAGGYGFAEAADIILKSI